MAGNRDRIASGGRGIKSTGIVRRIDGLGRVVIPIELRRSFGISEGDPLEVFVDSDCIVFRKLIRECALCNARDGLEPFRDKYVCAGCRNALIQSRRLGDVSG